MNIHENKTTFQLHTESMTIEAKEKINVINQASNNTLYY